MNSRKRMAFIRMALAVIAVSAIAYMAWNRFPTFDFATIIVFFALYLSSSVVETVVYQPPDSSAFKDDDRQTYVYMQITSLAVLFYALLDFVSFHITRLYLLEPEIIWAGFALFLVSLVIRYRAIQMLGKYYNPRVAVYESHELITEGPYGFIRHPLYLSAFCSEAAVSMIFNSWGAMILVLIGVLPALLYRIHVEEEFLQAHFRDEYGEYRTKTKRLFPWIW